jgi:hypothetical protein
MEVEMVEMMSMCHLQQELRILVAVVVAVVDLHQTRAETVARASL